MTAHQQERKPPDSADLYFGQKPPGIIPEQFATHLTSTTGGRGGFVFSKMGDEVFFFEVNTGGRNTLMHSVFTEGYWTQPTIAVKPELDNEVHPFFSPNENKLIFGSDRRVNINTRVQYFNLWSIERTEDGWSKPSPLSTTINTGFENCGSFDANGILYFRRVSPSTKGDIYQSTYFSGEFSPPIKLPKEINTAYDESHPCIARDGSYLVFSSKRPGGFSDGKDELWVSFRSGEETWSRAKNLGGMINDGHNTSCATISPDGKYLFFLRIEGDVGIPYWVSTNVIKKLFQQKED